MPIWVDRERTGTTGAPMQNEGGSLRATRRTASSLSPLKQSVPSLARSRCVYRNLARHPPQLLAITAEIDLPNLFTLHKS